MVTFCFHIEFHRKVTVINCELKKLKLLKRWLLSTNYESYSYYSLFVTYFWPYQKCMFISSHLVQCKSFFKLYHFSFLFYFYIMPLFLYWASRLSSLTCFIKNKYVIIKSRVSVTSYLKICKRYRQFQSTNKSLSISNITTVRDKYDIRGNLF